MQETIETIDLAGACRILGISRGYGYQTWTGWQDYGVRILKHRPNARPRFYPQDIRKMMERSK